RYGSLSSGHNKIHSLLVRSLELEQISRGFAPFLPKSCCLHTDLLLTWGQSHVNESMITGEARPVAKKKCDVVIGGTLNANGVLHVQATRVGSESALSQIVRLVESAKMAKAPVQKFADRFSKYFVALTTLQFSVPQVLDHLGIGSIIFIVKLNNFHSPTEFS
ncbi:hypothetical protein IFM89_002781, partial [Coptis chinensis]